MRKRRTFVAKYLIFLDRPSANCVTLVLMYSCFDNIQIENQSCFRGFSQQCMKYENERANLYIWANIYHCKIVSPIFLYPCPYWSRLKQVSVGDMTPLTTLQIIHFVISFEGIRKPKGPTWYNSPKKDIAHFSQRGLSLAHRAVGIRDIILPIASVLPVN